MNIMERFLQTHKDWEEKCKKTKPSRPSVVIHNECRKESFEFSVFPDGDIGITKEDGQSRASGFNVDYLRETIPDLSRDRDWFLAVYVVGCSDSEKQRLLNW